MSLVMALGVAINLLSVLIQQQRLDRQDFHIHVGHQPLGIQTSSRSPRSGVGSVDKAEG